MMSVYKDGKRAYAMICCELSNAVLASTATMQLKNVTDTFMSQAESQKKTDCVKNMVIDKT